MEVADLVVVNKADGNLLEAAKHTCADYSGAMKFVRRKHQNWAPPVMLASARTGEGLQVVLNTITRFHKQLSLSGELRANRVTQSRHWMWQTVQDTLVSDMKHNIRVREAVQSMETMIGEGTVTPRAAAHNILDVYFQDKRTKIR
jgi:LAO/AO transport system kinase